MEKGTISIIATKSNKQIVRISFIKSDGKQGVIDATFWTPAKEEQKYNGTACEIERDKGQLVLIKLEDGRIIQKEVAAPAAEKRQPGAAPINTDNDMNDSYDVNLSCLPVDTKKALSGVNPDNFLLKWQKGARHVEGPTPDKNKFMFFKYDRKGEKYTVNPNYGNIDFAQLALRELACAKTILGDAHINSFVLTTQWRLVQGLGLESVYETSLTLHHVYGIPYIPASALKGVVRSWIITNVYESKEQDALTDPLFCDWFGCPKEILIEENKKKKRYPTFYKEARQGNLVFFDVFPLQRPQLKVDVINPHYQPYYSDTKGEKPPADYYKTNPVFFLTVTNTPFQFIVGGRNREVLTQTLKTGGDIAYWVADALANHGIGAKTAVGYGYMKRAK